MDGKRKTILYSSNYPYHSDMVALVFVKPWGKNTDNYALIRYKYCFWGVIHWKFWIVYLCLYFF